MHKNHYEQYSEAYNKDTTDRVPKMFRRKVLLPFSGEKEEVS